MSARPTRERPAPAARAPRCGGARGREDRGTRRSGFDAHGWLARYRALHDGDPSDRLAGVPFS